MHYGQKKLPFCFMAAELLFVIVRVIFLMLCRRVTEACRFLGELQMKLKIHLFVTDSHHLRKNARQLVACAVTCPPLVAFSSCLRISGIAVFALSARRAASL